jgi:protein-tyrosine phosphatase
MKILMVCLGNICRSPMAEGIMRKKIEERGLPYTVDSAGTANYHVGENPDGRAVQKMKSYKTDISKLCGRQFTKKDFDAFDLILAMDDSNYRNIHKLARSEEDKNKVHLILNFVSPGSNMSVPDPYYGGDEGFEHVYQLLNEACDRVLDKYVVK